MSLLNIGTRCTSCPSVDFLPLTCPDCLGPFCSLHIQTHECPESASSSSQSTQSQEVGKVKRRRVRCPIQGCGKVTIQAVAGVEDDEGVGKEVRCEGCGVAFCVCHRQQDQHSCPAPSSHTARERATQERKERAQQILQLHFPGTTSKPRPTLPPQKDVDIKRKLPSTTVDQTVTSSSSSSSSASKLHEPRDVSVEDKEGVKVVKTTTKAAKIHQLHLRKLRSLAEPLERPKGVEEMRYFEWCLCTDHGKVKSWLYTGKWEGEVQRGAIACDTSCGKLLDLLISKTKVKRPGDPLDTSSVSLIQHQKIQLMLSELGFDVPREPA
ncbi:hypothetical protein TREMEDRAFT_27039 [Tremella mesenterica DSM 1558]|uniref:uncharacterized protein n=1 Tax=Tremella mesenterica (strain ATCC 24925 / CBS 8224 / DSM 1558 / NBRC 9311 / NRRL Y-6157 / RJB 2259-6 / UBC 559-6) TaxID=578456 RepID=UPI0003F4A198|nr:uncharacterized protein TREMEDRAFT_27039 [Tremella mesenterica DSM 1558]EIW71110.1 hypothetical protein TREMEDRAFT_27039 [Tremella mesenterica DSM 1558]